jgi:hypothetical protein
MRSTLVTLAVGVVGSLIAGLLLLPKDSGTLTVQVLVSLALEHWGWSLVILAISLLSGLAYGYRVNLCLFVIERSASDRERVRKRLASKGSNSEVANQVVQVQIDRLLMGWQKDGDWTGDDSHDPHDLRVTNSDRGGILTRTLSWTDYEFEFETKIERKCTAWIVRAYDLDNYVMLQCWPDKITPLYRRDGLWWSEQETRLPRTLPGGWFKVCIRVEKETISVLWLEDGRRTVLFEDDLLGPRTVSLTACRPSPSQPQYVNGEVFLSYLRGGVGFRACGDESALFRNITVRQIVDDE